MTTAANAQKGRLSSPATRIVLLRAPELPLTDLREPLGLVFICWLPLDPSPQLVRRVPLWVTAGLWRPFCLRKRMPRCLTSSAPLESAVCPCGWASTLTVPRGLTALLWATRVSAQTRIPLAHAYSARQVVHGWTQTAVSSSLLSVNSRVSAVSLLCSL